jgi:hypothetical protein
MCYNEYCRAADESLRIHRGSSSVISSLLNRTKSPVFIPDSCPIVDAFIVCNLSSEQFSCRQLSVDASIDELSARVQLFLVFIVLSSRVELTTHDRGKSNSFKVSEKFHKVHILFKRL